MMDDETKDRLADEYIEKISELPEFMSDAHLIEAIVLIVSGFSVNDDHVKHIMIMAMMSLIGKPECNCPSCVENRKDTIH